ncbi:MAG TPA: hypothetical protein VFU49_22305 [Ktedonobacteraceae bacterium]|nr:hypothetical protein [Ktedonobacteraceae bacterium]
MSLPFTDQQCFFVAILVFAVVGFQRGWRREMVSLVFVLMAVFLVRPDSSKSFGQAVSRLPGTFSFLVTGTAQSGPANAGGVNLLGPLGSLLIFVAIAAVGYLVGNKAFGKPTTPQERIIGIVPAIVSGAFVLAFLSNFFPKNPAGQSLFTVAIQPPDPGNYLPVIFLIAVTALVVALIAARTKKTPAKK